MSSTKPSKLGIVYPAVVTVAAVAVGGVAVARGGTSSAPFLFGATLALGWVLWLVFRAAQSLAREAPAVEIGAVATGKRRKELEREKQALLKALKELEFDHKMGKVSDKDFAEIGGTYRARAIRVMRQLDDAGSDYEKMIEDDVRKRLSAGSAEPSAPQAAADKCPKCSTKNDDDAEFCKKCGTKLVKEAS